ncbi:MAG: TolB family protein, partial [Steroidobacteraceae bacterium]
MAASGAVAAPERPGTVRAFGRSIPLDTYLNLAHAESVFVDQRAKRVYLAQAHGDSKRLAQLTLPQGGERRADFAAARPVSPVDLSKRNFWGAAYSAVLGRTIVLTDEAGEERTNLYAVAPDGRFERLTDVGYVYGWSLSPDGRSLVYASRESVEFSPGTIRLIDLTTRSERVLFRDSKAMRPYWSTPSWRADGGAVLLTMVLDEDRAQQNVALVSTSGDASGAPRLVTRTTLPRELILPRHAWVDERSFVYISTENGEHELQHVALDGTVRPLPLRAPGQLNAAAVIHVRGRPHVVAIVSGAVSDAIHILDAATGRTVFTRSLAETVALESAEGDRAILRSTSHTNPV